MGSAYPSRQCVGNRKRSRTVAISLPHATHRNFHPSAPPLVLPTTRPPSVPRHRSSATACVARYTYIIGTPTPPSVPKTERALFSFALVRPPPPRASNNIAPRKTSSVMRVFRYKIKTINRYGRNKYDRFRYNGSVFPALNRAIRLNAFLNIIFYDRLYPGWQYF